MPRIIAVGIKASGLAALATAVLAQPPAPPPESARPRASPFMEMARATAIHKAVKDGHEVDLECRSLQLGSIGPGDELIVHEVVMWRDSSSGLFVAQIELLQTSGGTIARPGDLLANTVVSVERTSIRAFSYIRYALSIRESTASYGSMDEGHSHVVAELSRSFTFSDNNEASFSPEGETVIGLWNRLPRNFTEHSADLIAPPTRLRDLVHADDCWRMVLDGPNGMSTPINVDHGDELSITTPCGQPRSTSRSVQLVIGSERRQMLPASRNGRPITIPLHAVEVSITYPDGETGRLQLLTLYDTVSHLFWWTVYSMTGNASPRTAALLFPDPTVYLTSNRIVVFLSARSVRDSQERYPSRQAARDQVLRLLERMRGRIQLGRSALAYRAIDWGRVVPRPFFALCRNAYTPPERLTKVTRTNGLWQLTVVGANRNSVTASLDDGYEILNATLSPPVPRSSIERVVRSETIPIVRDGTETSLELRELLVSHPTSCLERTTTRVIALFDAANHLGWWTRRTDGEPAFNPAIYETKDQIVVFSGTAPHLDVRESAARYASLDDLLDHVATQMWRNNFTRYRSVDLTRHLPPQFSERVGTTSVPTVAPAVSPTNGLWRIVVPGANGQTAVVVLDGDYTVVSATVQRH